MKYCRKCGQEWADSFQFCPYDASALQSAPADPLLGQVLGNKYEIIDRLGRGPHGTLYRAHHRIADEPRAVKLLHPELTQTEEQLRQLKTVVRFGLRLSSPHTVRLYDFDYAEGIGYFRVEELVEGQSLQTLLGERNRLPASLSTSVARQVSESLAEAHAHGISHGHLVPTNVLLTGGLPELTAKVSDYGLRGLMGPSGTVSGPDVEGDLVSLGALLFQMLTGEPTLVSGGESSRALRDGAELRAELQRAQTPQPLAQLTLSLLGLETQRHFGSATEVSLALSSVAAPAPIKTEVPAAAPPAVEGKQEVPAGGVGSWWSGAESQATAGEPLPSYWERRVSFLRVGILIGLVALVGVLGFWLLRGKPAPQSKLIAESAPKEVVSVPLPTFDYEVAQRANEGDPVKHPHVLVRIDSLPLYVIRDKGSYPSTVARAEAAKEALDRATENLRGNPSLPFVVVIREGNPTIVQEGPAKTDQLPIVAVTRADVYAYNIRGERKTTQGDLAQWWLARTRDYFDFFVLGKIPRLTTRTEDGAALARLYELAHARAAPTSRPIVGVLHQALSELDPKLREVLQTGVFKLP